MICRCVNVLREEVINKYILGINYQLELVVGFGKNRLYHICTIEYA